MPKIDLSDAGLRSFKAPSKGAIDYWDTKLPGFGCRVSQGRAKSFILKLHNSRKALGRYPIVSLSEARIEAKKLLAEKTLGRLRPTSVSFPTAVEEFLEEKTARRRPVTVVALRRHLGLLGFKCAIGDVTQADLSRKLKFLKRSEFNHRLSCTRAFFNWAQKKRYVTDNPTVGFSAYSITSRSRTLSDSELKAVWRASELDDGHFGSIVKLLILTGMRRGECAALQRAWIINGMITIPSHVTKNAREFSFPVGTIGSDVLRTALPKDDSVLLFPARGKPQTPFNGWSKCKIALDKVAKIEPWTLHDLRRTFATNLAQLDVAPHIIERMLNHVSGQISGVAAIYNRHRYSEQMRTAIDIYEKHLAKVLELS